MNICFKIPCVSSLLIDHRPLTKNSELGKQKPGILVPNLLLNYWYNFGKEKKEIEMTTENSYDALGIEVAIVHKL